MSTGDYLIHWHSYNHMSGGIRALHVLRDVLREAGHRADMSYERRFEDGDIAVYPEVIPNNPLGAKHIVRWLLNTATLPNDGLIYTWDRNLGPYPELTVNILELELWEPGTGPRSGVAYYEGKRKRFDHPIIDGATRIGFDTHPDRAGLAEFVKSLELLVTFDPYSAVIAEATLVGTPVLVLAGDDDPAKAIGKGHPWNLYGVAWDVDELPWARDSVHLARGSYLSMLPVFKRRVRNFIRDTQKAFT